MYGCIQKSLFTLDAEIYHQISEQDPETNEFKRRWVLFKAVPCAILPIRQTGSSTTSDNKFYSKEYIEDLETRMHTMEQLSKRWRVSSIKNSYGEILYKEIDRVSEPPTIFEVVGSHPVVDMFGKVQYYENFIKRVLVQGND